MPVKPIVWVGASRTETQLFPEAVRREVGHELWLVQQGEAARDWRPMPDVGAGVIELRIQTEQEHRVFYVAKFEEAVYVLHAFEKKSRKTSRRDLQIGQTRYRQVVEARRTGRT
jgi:phage-related protein